MSEQLKKEFAAAVLVGWSDRDRHGGINTYDRLYCIHCKQYEGDNFGNVTHKPECVVVKAQEILGVK